MRRILFAASFDREVEDIGVYLEERFGEPMRRRFLADLASTCDLIARFPGLGMASHGYQTHLMAFVFRQNWIFFDYDDDSVQFLHIVDARRDKTSFEF